MRYLSLIFGPSWRRENQDAFPCLSRFPWWSWVDRVCLKRLTHSHSRLKLKLTIRLLMLFCRSEKGSIQVFDLGADGQQLNKVTTVTLQSMVKDASRIAQVWPLNHFFSVRFFCKKRCLICLEGNRWRTFGMDIVLSHSSQRLPRVERVILS